MQFYDSVTALDECFAQGIEADVILIGSYVPDGARVAEWVLAHAHPNSVTVFYDIDTPVTLARLASAIARICILHSCRSSISICPSRPCPTLERLERQFGAQRARELFCSVDADDYYPEPREIRYDLGYLGTYSEDRQPKLEELMLQPARHWRQGGFCVAGAQYPPTVVWPPNLQHVEHLPPGQHRAFYNEQRFTLNLTRADMVKSGHSPSVRLFEAAACGVPIISDPWSGLEALFVPGVEIMLATQSDDTPRVAA